MFVEANALQPGGRFESEVCIVGAGAAGITLARTLARHGIRTVLLESGGMAFDEATQKLADVVTGPRYLFQNMRLRYFGGSTNHWGGLCRPLDAEDFLPRAWVPDSGWPIRRADLDPYYPEAMSILDIPPRLHAVSFQQLAEDTEHKPYLLDENPADFEPIVWFQSSPTTRMNEKYRNEIRDSGLIRCFLHANATELVVDESGSRVTSVKVRTLAGRSFTFVAKIYVLCAGGIENARLLLLSDTVVKGAIGNRYDLVGRYLMEHLSTPVPCWLAIVPPNGTGRFQEEDLCERSRAGRLPGIKDDLFGFATRPALRRRDRLLACSVNTLGAPETEPKGVSAAIRDLLATPRSGSAPGAAQAVRVYRVLVLAEQSPNPNSRISLGAELDALGQRKAVVDLKFQDEDLRSVRTSVDFFARAIGTVGRGRIQLNESEPSPYAGGGGHDMGTTRMADDPTHGVTDRHGRVHGVENLFIAGSSLFSTSGFANPTLTIVALTLRLADLLKQVVHAASTPSRDADRGESKPRRGARPARPAPRRTGPLSAAS